MSLWHIYYIHNYLIIATLNDLVEPYTMLFTSRNLEIFTLGQFFTSFIDKEYPQSKIYKQISLFTLFKMMTCLDKKFTPMGIF